MRNIINNIITKVLFVAILAITPGCTDNFLNYNTLPDEPSKLPDAVAYGLALKDMQCQILPAAKNKYQRSENLLGGVYGRYFATANTSWTQTHATFNAPAGWISSYFDNPMADVYANWIKINQMSGGGEGVNYAWAQVLRIAAMHRLTDIVGPILTARWVWAEALQLHMTHKKMCIWLCLPTSMLLLKNLSLMSL